jgi:hypothetical protein
MLPEKVCCSVCLGHLDLGYLISVTVHPHHHQVLTEDVERNDYCLAEHRCGPACY